MPVKELIARLAKGGGALAAVRDSRWRQDRLLVLCYHGVSMSDEHIWSPELFVTPEHLRSRLRFLRDNDYRILPLAEALPRLYAGTLPPRSIAITFDDGGVDFARSAVPILEDLDVPVTLYLTTHYATQAVPVFNTVLSYVLWKGRREQQDAPTLDDISLRLETATAATRLETWRALQRHAIAADMTTPERDALVGRVAAALGVDYEEIRRAGTLQIMSPAQIESLPHPLVDVQLHTHRHRVPRDRAGFMREISDNAVIIRELRGDSTPLEHFAYPSGVHHADAVTWLRECGVRFATTCETDLASRATDPLLIPRFFDTTMQPPVIFESWASGFHALLPRRRAVPQVQVPFAPERRTQDLALPVTTRARRPISRR